MNNKHILSGGWAKTLLLALSTVTLLAAAPASSSPFLRRRGAEAEHCFGDCRLDATAHKLFRAGKEVALTAKEYRLLEFFLKRAGRALTRDSILDAVWGREVFVTERSVDRCVTTLRAKVEADPRHPKLIQTIRDIGYRFETGT